MEPRTSYSNAGNFTIPFPFPKPYDSGLCYYVLAPKNSASFGFARQPNLHIERIEAALAALPETDVKFFRELAKAFLCYGKLAAIFRIFIGYHNGSPQVEASSIRYYDVDNPDGGPQETMLSLDWAGFNRRLVGLT
ncbi:hypothetical protein [Cupriavidus pauculus]|uniref:hypothetical protein n=1 Tax=Cupriavidus pauculus TaxID=82633 RepID=UPI00078506CE|nr:hypothetical protein [Cupriavidus pauculus]